MEILFKNKTKYTKEIYEKYLQFHQNKFGDKYKFITILIILLLSFCIVTNFRCSNYDTGFVLIIFLVLFCFNRFFYPIKKVEKELKTEKFKNEKEFTFIFYDSFFVISDKKNSEKIKYWKLHRIYETKEFFYLYINKDHAFLLDKSSFTKGDTSDFLKFLRKKFGLKYKNKRGMIKIL